MDPEEEVVDDVRGDIESAIKEVAEREAPEESAPVEKPEAEKEIEKPAKARDDTGKFTKEVKGEPEPAKIEAKPAAPPNTWTAAAKAKWKELPADIQSEIAKREADVEKGFTRLDEERSVGKSFKEVVSPYMPMIQSEGSTPIVAIQSLLNTAYKLRTATAQEKGQMLMDLAKQYGADLSTVSQGQPQTDPNTQAIHRELADVKARLNGFLTEREQQEQGTITSLIDAFAADPKNVHYEAVKADMAALLRAGRAKDLQDAYDKAVWASPDIRSTLLEQQLADKEAKRVAEAREKADKARKASVSISGSPGATAPSKANHEDRSLREELEANLAAARSA
jgi:hypothetical protein